MSTAIDVREALVARVAACASLGAEGQVKAGRFDRPPRGTPFAGVHWVATTEQIGPTLCDRKQEGTFVVTAWASEASTPQERQLAAEELAVEIRAALRADPTLGGTVRRHSTHPMVFEAMDPQRPEKAYWGVIFVEVRAEWVEH